MGLGGLRVGENKATTQCRLEKGLHKWQLWAWSWARDSSEWPEKSHLGSPLGVFAVWNVD